MKYQTLPPLVARLRAAAYREIIGLCEALQLDYYTVNLSLSMPGEGRGLAFGAASYERLLQLAPSYLDKRYFHLLSPWTEPEYPFSQARIAVHGSAMESPLSSDFAMHQGVYINLYPLYERAFWAGKQEKDYFQLQAQIKDYCMDMSATEERKKEEYYRRLIQKRAQIMTAGESERGKKNLQLFPWEEADYALCLLEKSGLDASPERLLEPEEEVWPGFEFEVADDLVSAFGLKG